MAGDAKEVIAHGDVTPEIYAAMRVSINGWTFEQTREAVATRRFALFSMGHAFALVSRDGRRICVEAVEGDEGSALTAKIIESARVGDFECETWVFCRARARLAKRVGFYPTGKTRVGANGVQQLHLMTS